MKSILICPHPEFRSNFERLVASQSNLRVTKVLDYYPDEELFRQLLKVWAPDVIFMSMENFDAVADLTQQLITEFPTLQRVGLSEFEDPSQLRLALHLRMAEMLVPPGPEDIAFQLNSAEFVMPAAADQHFDRMLARLSAHLAIHPPQVGNLGKIWAFMPAKGGVGASTIAANTIYSVAEKGSTKVLLADFDASSGVTGFAFNVEHGYSVSDATERNKELDEETWERLIKKVGNIDLMLSGAPVIGNALATHQISPVLDYARRAYQVVGADVPDSLDERSLAVLREANQIFLVTTPDLAALRLAKLKIMALGKLDLEDKTKLLLNRETRKMELSTKEIESTVGLPIFASFPCEYADVTKATRKAAASPKLAPSIHDFLEKLTGSKRQQKPRSRFIERFAVVPARYGYR
jgi:MinD-like ATPase involved in chromosome partitioning or flagellar assembly